MRLDRIANTESCEIALYVWGLHPPPGRQFCWRSGGWRGRQRTLIFRGTLHKCRGQGLGQRSLQVRTMTFRYEILYRPRIFSIDVIKSLRKVQMRRSDSTSTR